MITLPEPDGKISAQDVMNLSEDLICKLPIPTVDGSPLEPEDIWRVVILATVKQTSVWQITNETEDTPCGDTVRTWLHGLDRDRLESVAALLFMRVAMTMLDPDQSRIVSIDFIDNPYHGDPDEDEGELCTMEPKDGTYNCHRYCTAYLVSNGKPVTLAMTYVRSDETQAEAVERVLERLAAYPFDIELLLADGGFYNERIIRRSREIASTIIPVPNKGDRLNEKLDVHCSYMTTYRMYKDTDRELEVPLAVAVSYLNGDRGQHGEVVRGYVACGLEDHTPKQVERLYRKRGAIETSYKLFRQARATTSTQDPIMRFAYVLVGFLLENLWLLIRWAYIAEPRRGGRKIPTQFTFLKFRDWVEHGLNQKLDRQWETETNGVGVPDSYSSDWGISAATG